MKASKPPVSDHMTPEPSSLRPEDTLLSALETVRLRAVRRIPGTVAGMLVGPVTDNDLVRALVDHLRGAETEEKS